MYFHRNALLVLLVVALVAALPALTFGSPSSARLSHVRFWADQIQNVEADGSLQRLADSRYDLLVIDDVRSVKGDEGFDVKGAVAMLHSSVGSQGQPKLVLAYVDIGEAEDYRWYWQGNWSVGNPDWIVAQDPDGWAGNYPVLFWRPAWKSILLGSLTSYLDKVLADGFDGVYLDWMEATTFEPVASVAAREGKDARAEMVSLVAQLASYVRSQKPNFIVVPQNALDLARPNDSITAQYLATIDGVAQEGVWFDGTSETVQGDLTSNFTSEYLRDLAVFQSAGKTIFTIDYAQEPDHAVNAYKQAAARGFLEYVALRQLDHLTTTPPPEYAIPEFNESAILLSCALALAMATARRRGSRGKPENARTQRRPLSRFP